MNKKLFLSLFVLGVTGAVYAKCPTSSPCPTSCTTSCPPSKTCPTSSCDSDKICGDDVFGHSFFSIRPVFQSSMPEKVSLWRDRALARDCGWGGAFQIVPLGGRSTRSKDLATFFTIPKRNLVFATDGDPALQGNMNPNARDVNAFHFNIQCEPQQDAEPIPFFSSIVNFSPRHTFGGVGFDYKQYLHCRDACCKRWWLELSTPLVHVSNDMRLDECVTHSCEPLNDNVNQSVCEAFKGQKGIFSRNANMYGAVTDPVWCFGKIDGKQKKTRLADVEVKIGYDWVCEDKCHADSYIGAVIPAGNRPKGEYVFEPIVGNNFHGGIMWGSSFGFEVWNCCEKTLHLEIDTNWRYLFSNSQTRSFDVGGKPLSRYQVVYKNQEAAVNEELSNGINIFTKKLRVKPRFNKDINTAFVYTSCNFQGEVGYNFWARQGEQVCLRSCDPFITDDVKPAFACVISEPPKTNGQINRAINLKENFEGSCIDSTPENYERNRIQEQELNLASAAHPCTITHIVYGTLGYRWDDLCYPTFVGLGASYEFSSLNTGLNRWMVWGKFGFSI